MDRNEIIRMAREAEDKVIANQDLDWKQEFAALVAAAEREACAKVCAYMWCKEPEPGDARDCYDAIRARGNT